MAAARLTGNGGEWFSIWGHTRGVPEETHVRKTLHQEGFKTPRVPLTPSPPPRPAAPADAKQFGHTTGGVLRSKSRSPSKKGSPKPASSPPVPEHHEVGELPFGGVEEVPATVTPHHVSLPLDPGATPADANTSFATPRGSESSPKSRKGAKSCVPISSTRSRDDLSPNSRKAARSLPNTGSQDVAVPQVAEWTARPVVKPREDTSCVAATSGDVAEPCEDSLSRASPDGAKLCVDVSETLHQSHGMTNDNEPPKTSVGARSCLSKALVVIPSRYVSWKSKLSACTEITLGTSVCESPTFSNDGVGDDDGAIVERNTECEKGTRESEKATTDGEKGTRKSTELASEPFNLSPDKKDLPHIQPTAALVDAGAKKSNSRAQSAPPCREHQVPCSKALATWSVKDVCAWATTLPCLPGEVASVFKREAVNGLVLSTFTEVDLMLLGISKFGWRRHLILQIQQLQAHNGRKAQEVFEAPRVQRPWTEQRARKDPFSVSQG